MISLKDKWVLVTGAGRGLGRLTATKLLEYGVNLILVSRDASHTADIEAAAKEHGQKAVSFGEDLGSKSDVEALIDKLEEFDIDVVFNNAGIQVTYRAGEDVWDTPWEDYEKSFRVNTIAPMMICYALLPKMIERGFGRILNTTSGIAGEPEQGPYSASKAGLDKVTADLVKMVERANADSAANQADVLLFLLDPGWCRTDLGGPNAPNDPADAVTGYIAGAFASKGKSGMLVCAQDYRDMTLEEAVARIESC